MTLKTNLRKYRFLKDEMTQKQLADLVQVSRQTIHAIERGKFNPSVRLALLIAQVFQSLVEDIFFLE
jgi:putative transcriptional regulator